MNILDLELGLLVLIVKFTNVTCKIMDLRLEHVLNPNSVDSSGSKKETKGRHAPHGEETAINKAPKLLL